MAWLDREGRFEVVILQETHWRDSTDFRSGRWYCIHSSGYGSEVSYDRFGGILVMLRQEAFEEPSVQELYPGRLLHVRAVHKQSSLTVDVLGIYQHVQRTHLPPEQSQASDSTSGTPCPVPSSFCPAVIPCFWEETSMHSSRSSIHTWVRPTARTMQAKTGIGSFRNCLENMTSVL